MLEGAQRGLRTFAFSARQLSHPKDPFWVFTLGSWKPGWGRKPALSRGRAWAPTKTAAIFACCCFPQPPVSTQPLPSSAGKHEEPPAALARPRRCQAALPECSGGRAPHLHPSDRPPASTARGSHGAANAGPGPLRAGALGEDFTASAALPARARLQRGAHQPR